jgi:hypothetical protein
MEQFFIFQVRVNLIQQNLVTLDSTDTSNIQRIATDILQLYHDIQELKNPLMNDEYFPQIENLCTILESKTTTLTVANDKI